MFSEIPWSPPWQIKGGAASERLEVPELAIATGARRLDRFLSSGGMRCKIDRLTANRRCGEHFTLTLEGFRATAVRCEAFLVVD